MICGRYVMRSSRNTITALFLIVETENSRYRGMLALSWIEEEQCFGHFPGEMWHGKTWLEQNKIIATDTETFKLLVSHIPAAAEIRYLAVDRHLAASFGYRG